MGSMNNKRKKKVKKKERKKNIEGKSRQKQRSMEKKKRKTEKCLQLLKITLHPILPAIPPNILGLGVVVRGGTKAIGGRAGPRGRESGRGGMGNLQNFVLLAKF